MERYIPLETKDAKHVRPTSRILENHALFLNTIKTELTNDFGQEQFFSAASHLKNYLDNDASSFSDKKILSAVFLHLPKVAKEHRQVQSEKMILAFPGSVKDINALTLDDIEVDFMSEVENIIGLQMNEASFNFPAKAVQDLGVLMGYVNTHDSFETPEAQREMFATAGIKTFRKGLEDVIEEADYEGRNLVEKIIEEFSQKDGIIHKLMRVTNFDFQSLNFDNTSLNEIRELLQFFNTDDEEDLKGGKTKFSKGFCPAGFPMPITDDTGNVTKRPIALEYAVVIARKFDELGAEEENLYN